MKIIEIGIAILSAILMLVGLFMIVNSSLEAFPTRNRLRKQELVV